ncbi:MAG: macro domain-containing protein [Desulfitobacteriaceae bacterium]|nr:macro domain-containing protein [Desulfitobacteriaceae bacterium]
MLTYTTGDLLKSSAEALVNTVNCEGYMGKGIAYQFKLQFPKNNEDYVRACKSGALAIGKLHYYKEKGKLIINFPTKNKWREKSHMEYIEKGLDQLVVLIQNLSISSIAIPPLGSGNGGLIWSEVKLLIERKLLGLSQNIDVFIYEPSKSYSSQPTFEPKLSTSALVLMEIKHNLVKFSKFRLQKTAYFVDVFSSKKYFNFKKHKFGPYDHSIDIISKKIYEFQLYHGTRNTDEAKVILYNKIISERVENKLLELNIPIEKACSYVNTIKDDHELECLSTVCFLIEQNASMSTEQILTGFKQWSEDKAARFTDSDILLGIENLHIAKIIEKDLIGFSIARNLETGNRNNVAEGAFRLPHC